MNSNKLAHSAVLAVLMFALPVAPLPVVFADTVQDGARAQAKQHFETGQQHFREGRWADAIVSFRAAERLVPSPILLFNIGVCEEKLGHDADALKLYESYLAASPNASNKADVEQRIANIRARKDARDKGADLYAPIDEGTPPPPPRGTPAPGDDGTVRDAPADPGLPKGLRPVPDDDPMASRLPSIDPAQTAQAAGAAQAGPTMETEPARGEPYADARQPNPPAPEPAPTRPLYKEWWFWTVVGVSAIVLVSVASTATVDAPVLFRF